MKLTNEDADRYLEDVMKMTVNTLKVKGKEYIRNDDRMHNFNAAAIKKNITREQALDGMRLKHEVSIDDMRDDIAEGNIPSRSLVDEKFGDIINYYILEYMSVRDRIDKQTRKEKTYGISRS